VASHLARPCPQDKQAKTLPLRLRPTDHNCHPAFATCEPCTRLLVRLTRPAAVARTNGATDGATDGGGGWSAEVVAAVPRLYRWTTPADYQYVGFDSRPVEDQGASGWRLHLLLAAPRSGRSTAQRQPGCQCARAGGEVPCPRLAPACRLAACGRCHVHH
jgi:hypothetical protein